MYVLPTVAWNGIVFNCILYWAERDFLDDRDELAARLTAMTVSLYDTPTARMKPASGRGSHQ